MGKKRVKENTTPKIEVVKNIVVSQWSRWFLYLVAIATIIGMAVYGN